MTAFEWCVVRFPRRRRPEKYRPKTPSVQVITPRDAEPSATRHPFFGWWGFGVVEEAKWQCRKMQSSSFREDVRGEMR